MAWSIGTLFMLCKLSSRQALRPCRLLCYRHVKQCRVLVFWCSLLSPVLQCFPFLQSGRLAPPDPTARVRLASLFRKILSCRKIHNIGLVWRIQLRHSVRMRSGPIPPELIFWKWSNGVKISEMGIFWCISITNNVKSCRKFNEKAQTVNFSVFTMCGRELPAEKAYFW